MLVTGSNRFLLNPKGKEILNRMTKDGSFDEDMEEGEISDSAEEISEEGFKQDSRVSKPKEDSKVWMKDLLKYPISNGYTPGLYNFAWAQAVKNKPLNDNLTRDFGSDEKSTKSTSNRLGNSIENNFGSSDTSKNACNVREEIDGRVVGGDEKVEDRMVGEDEKEEGELEEGEIELDSETMNEREEGSEGILREMSVSDTDLKEIEFEKKLNSIHKTLESVIVNDAEKSFPTVCSQLQTSLESLQAMVLGSRALAIDAVIRQFFTGIQAINSVFCSMNLKQQEQNKEILWRLLARVNNQDPSLFSPDQMKEIETMLRSLNSQSKEKEMHVNNEVNRHDAVILSENAAHDINSSRKLLLDPISVKYGDQNNVKMVPEISKLATPFGFKSRLSFGPLLDLHRDHDADSLPSPTRETPPPLPLQNPQTVIDGTVKSDLTRTELEDIREDNSLHPYENDALKAVSTYQQKFVQTSLLPSPTPSEEGDDGDGDTGGEISSSHIGGNGGTMNTFVPLQPTGSATSHMDSLNGQGMIPASTFGQLSSELNSNLRPSAKSRDPRLRYANPHVGALDLSQCPLSVEYNTPKSEPPGGIMSLRKHKIVEDSVLDDHTMKRQRNGLTDSVVSRNMQMVSGSCGWLVDSCNVGTQLTDGNRLIENTGIDCQRSEDVEIGSGKGQDTVSGHFNVSTGQNDPLPAMCTTTTTVPLPSLFKDIAQNPSMLMHLIKMEQQRLVAEAQRKSGDLAQNMMHPSSSVPGTTSLVNIALSKSSELEQKLAGNPQIPTCTASMNPQGEWGKIRMKPRDPRRILHSNIFQKSDNSRPEQFKTNGASSFKSQDNVVVRQEAEQAEANSLSSQSSPPPDISWQFTKKLKNLAEILIASQATNSTLVVPQTVSSQSGPIKTEKVDVGEVATDPTDHRSGSDLTAEEVTVVPPQNAWEDVEHLFEGYDDQQKAAIQRERSRRIEEQKKMFAAQKLCLVLDLDHTLLNSAKFVEVDPVHDNILRKKEEQDRVMPQRHLFRFPHMAMWTKLRPGIWSFLEKASKLYELHLYTMGNKLYATEMAKVLDPTGVLFAGRVISKGDDGDPLDGDDRQPKSKDLDGVLGMESSVVIIDDSVRVWPHNKLNLIVVERYTYFPSSRRQFGLLGPSLLEIDHDERREDGTLASSLAVIERIHHNFFSHQSLNDVDVRNILASEQQKVLAGCRIVFSRVFPVGETNPHLHPLWQTAEQFGAVCTSQIDEQVTHVVANSLGTDKVNWARCTKRFVVHPGWLEASALLYRRANELDFIVKL